MTAIEGVSVPKGPLLPASAVVGPFESPERSRTPDSSTCASIERPGANQWRGQPPLLSRAIRPSSERPHMPRIGRIAG